MRISHPGFIIAAVALLVVCAATASPGQQRVYSYVDENGIRIFTNIPPKNSIAADLPALDASSLAIAPTSRNSKGVSQIESIINKYADHYKLDPKLVRSMIATESGFDSRAVSRKGAQGLMQLMPSTASRVGVKNPFDPEENIRGGMEHMRFLLDTFNNDLTLSLAAYNAGENIVQRIKRVPNYPETKAYVRTVTSRYGRKEVDNQSNSSAPRGPSTFKWLDAQGILHLSNIAPTQRPDGAFSSFAPVVPSPE